MEQYCANFGDLSCIGLRYREEKTDRQTPVKTRGESAASLISEDDDAENGPKRTPSAEDWQEHGPIIAYRLVRLHSTLFYARLAGTHR